MSSTACESLAQVKEQSNTQVYVQAYSCSSGGDNVLDCADYQDESTSTCTACTNWEGHVAALTTAWKEDLKEKTLVKQKLAAVELELHANSKEIAWLKDQLQEAHKARQQDEEIQKQHALQTASARWRVRLAEAGELEAVGKVNKLQQRVAELSTELGVAKRNITMLTEGKAKLSKDLASVRASLARFMLADAGSSACATPSGSHMTFYNGTFDSTELAEHRAAEHEANAAGGSSLDGMRDLNRHASLEVTREPEGWRRTSIGGTAELMTRHASQHQSQPQLQPRASLDSRVSQRFRSVSERASPFSVAEVCPLSQAAADAYTSMSTGPAPLAPANTCPNPESLPGPAQYDCGMATCMSDPAYAFQPTPTRTASASVVIASYDHSLAGAALEQGEEIASTAGTIYKDDHVCSLPTGHDSDSTQLLGGISGDDGSNPSSQRCSSDGTDLAIIRKQSSGIGTYRGPKVALPSNPDSESLLRTKPRFWMRAFACMRVQA